MCNCENKNKFFGLVHWWRYTRIRLKWRQFKAHIRYHKTAHGYWYDIWTDRIYNEFPGAAMTQDEFEHWF